MVFLGDKVSKEKKEQIFYIAVVCILNILFFFFIGDKGTLFEKDSSTYIKWSYLGIKRGYTLYPWFLKAIRSIHGEETYLTMIPVYQGAISIVSNCILVEYCRKRYSAGMIAGLFMHLFILAPYTYTLPDAVSSHYVLTEGLSIPLFHVSVFLLLKGVIDRSNRNAVASVLLGVMLFLLRPQLFIISAIYVSVIIIYTVYLRIQNKKSFLYITVVVLTLIFIVGVCTYFKIISGWANSKTNSQLIEATTGKALCLLKEEDSGFYSGLDRDIYLDLLNDGKKKGRLTEAFPRSLLDYESLHKIINENVTAHETLIWDHYISVRGDDGGESAYLTRNLITSTEILNHKMEYIGIILRLMPSSLVASVFFQPPGIRLICYIFTGILYVVAFCMNCILIRKRVNEIYILPGLIVHIIIFANALACNVLLYGQQRYVIYCMGVFYISMLI